MTFVAQGTILMDGKQAQAELDKTGKSAKGAGDDIRKLGKTGTDGARGVRRVGQEARTTAQRLGTARTRMSDYIRGMRGVDGANRLAAGSMGNLVAQGNDVVTMLAAGQNPMQLALQQGTQITQVIGPLGAAGAFRALGGAVLSMLSPINLVTIGSIAAGAALVNWLRSGEEEVESFEDQLEALDSRLSSIRTNFNLALGGDKLRERFGSRTSDARALLDDVVKVEAALAGFDLAEVVGSTVDEATGSLLKGNKSELSNLFDLKGVVGRGADEASRALVLPVLQAYEDLKNAADGSVSDQVAALQLLETSFMTAANASGSLSLEELKRLRIIQDVLEKTLALAGAEERNLPQARANNALVRRLGLAIERAEVEEEANQTIRERLSELNAENEIARATLQFGEDSVQVAELRADAERRALERVLESSAASEELKDELLQSFENGQKLAQLDMAKGIAGASAAALELADRLGISLSLAQQLQATSRILQAENTPLGLNPINVPTNIGPGPKKSTIVNPTKPPEKPGGGRSSAINKVERQREAVKNLLEAKQRELDILRETDPVQREMIRLRDRLKGATDEERKSVEARIVAIEAERQAKERRDDFESSLEDTLRNARSLADVWDGIGNLILEAAQNAILLGEGPLSDLFGGIFGSDGGGLIGGLSDAVGEILGFSRGGDPALAIKSGSGHRVSAYAGGGTPQTPGPGIIHGAGTGTSDSILALVSAGEQIMTAQATQRYRPLLDAMNAGALIPGFASGGLPLPANSASAPVGSAGGFGPAGQGSLLIRIAPSDLFQAVVSEKATDAAVEVVREFEANDLPRAVNRINDDPRRTG